MFKKSTVLVVLILLGQLFLVTPIPTGVKGDLSNPAALVVHGPIGFSSDSDFTLANGVSTGTGTASDPFIIENFKIDASSYTQGIYVSGTNKFFKVRNVWVYTNSAPKDTTVIGVWLNNVNNGTFENCRFNNLMYGIEMFKARYMVFKNNEINNVSSGILSYYYSRWNTFVGNHIHDTKKAISMEYSSYLTFYSNILWDNVYNLGFNSNYADQYEHTMPTNNTIDGKPIYYIVNRTDMRVTGPAGFLAIVNSRNVTADNMDLDNNYQSAIIMNSTSCNLDHLVLHNNYMGILFQESLTSLFGNSTIKDNYKGFGLDNSKYLKLKNNTFLNNTYHTWFDYAGLTEDWDHEISTDNTMDGKPVYYCYGTGSCHIPSNAGWAVVANCNHATIDGVDVSHNQYGVVVKDSYSTIVSNVTSHNNSDGIHLERGQDNIVQESEMYNNDVGLYARSTPFDQTINLRITHNLFHDNNIGTTLFVASVVMIDNNTYYNNKNGTLNSNILAITVVNNTIYNNSIVGVSLLSNTLAYNNYFSNAKDFATCPSCELNVSAFKSKNIVGGPYIGGNYWSNYMGADGNGDLLGDTNIPVNGLDMDPLLIPTDTVKPQVFDNTIGNPIVNTQFLINATATDNTAIFQVRTEFWFDAQAHQNFNLVPRMNVSHYFKAINVPDNVNTLSYFIMACDFRKNCASTKLVTLDVLNLYAITLEDRTDSTPVTGEAFMFKAHVKAKLNVAWVHANFSFDKSSWKEVPLNLSANYNYSANLTVPVTAHFLNYTLSAKDIGTHKAILPVSTLNVTDRLAPDINGTFAPLLPGKLNVLNFTITDNWKVAGANITYSFDSSPKTTEALTSNKSGYHAAINVPDAAFIMQFTARAWDTSGNIMNFTKELRTLDLIAPVIHGLEGQLTTGDLCTMVINITDNRDVPLVRIIYHFDDNVSTTLDLGTQRNFSVDVSSNATIFAYSIFAWDKDNNSVSLDGAIDVVDNDPPTNATIEGEFTTGDVCLITVHIHDNIQGASSEFIYWFDMDLKPRKITVVQDIGMNIAVPTNALWIGYNLTTKDLGGNSKTFTGKLPVRDDDAPYRVDVIGNLTTGDLCELNITAFDNIGVASVQFKYGYGNWPDTTASVEKNKVSIKILPSALDLVYNVIATDTSGNSKTFSGHFDILDNDPPVVQDLTKGQPQGGSDFAFKAMAIDNMVLLYVSIEYWFDHGGHKFKEMSLKDAIYECKISVPSGAGKLHYIVEAKDSSGNVGSSEAKSLTIKTSTGSLVEIAVGAMIVAVVSVVVAVLLLRRRGKGTAPSTVPTAPPTQPVMPVYNPQGPPYQGPG